MYSNCLKRVFDFIGSLGAMPILLFAIVVLSPLIYLDDRGPVFYRASRQGKNGQLFTMYKFRSMKVHSPDLRNEDGSTYNSKKDPRATRMGRILRKTSLDELPQLLNVLKGDMSFVGPRPTLPGKKSFRD
jgi:lipopolysaccharide/colanic/teichoic acid biosynthesis glycosyltransferase